MPKSRTIPNNGTGFQKFERKLQRRITWQQQYREVIQNNAVGVFASYKQSMVADKDVAWLQKLDHIGNPFTSESLANQKYTYSCPAANQLLWGWNTLAAMVVQRFALWVSIFLTLWRANGWMIIWSFLVRFWGSFCCFVYLIITSFIVMHNGLYWEFTMLRLIVDTFVFGHGIVAVIGLRVWLSCNCYFSILTRQKLPRMIIEPGLLFRLLR